MNPIRQARGAAARLSGRRAEVWAAIWLMLKGYRILGFRPAQTYTAALDFLRQEAAATAPLDLVTDAVDNGVPQRTGTWHLNPANQLSQHYTIARLRTAIGLILCSPEFLRR